MAATEIAAMLIVCDNPRHARGRVTKLATLVFYDDGSWEQRAPDHTRRLTRLKHKQATGADVRSQRIATVFGNDPIACGCGLPGGRACGARLPSDNALQRAAPRLAAIAEHGTTTITLTQLVVICGRE